MTLIIYSKCSDGIIIIADRKESNFSDIGETTKKYYLPDNQEFLFTMAGDSDRIDTVVSDLKQDQTITSTNVRTRLTEIMKESPDFGGDIKFSNGFLLVKQNNGYQFHNVRLSNTLSTIIDENPPHKTYGQGSPIAEYLIRKFKPYNYKWHIACQFLIAIMNEVSGIVDSVGKLEDYGYDLILITNSGEIKTCTISDDLGISTIEYKFDTDDDKKIECLSDEKPSEKIEEGYIEQLSVQPEEEFKASTASKKDFISKSYSVDFHGTSYTLNYKITNGVIFKIFSDIEAKSLIITMESTADGNLEVQIPRELLDSKHDGKDDVFFVLADGEEMEFEEKTSSDYRILKIPFYNGTEEIEIIGTHHPIVIKTDKNIYTYGSDIILTIINPSITANESIFIEILNSENKLIYKNSIPVVEQSKGIYQEIIPVQGKEWELPGENYKIKSKYKNQSTSLTIHTSDFGATLELDQKVYSWTDKVYIVLVAPEYNLDPTKEEIIGEKEDQNITISTSKGKITNYKLKETSKDTGIFTGEIILSGFKKDNLKDSQNPPLGITKGAGPTDGLIECSNDDGLTVTFTTPKKTIMASALIRWNIGEIHWLSAAYPAEGEGIVRILDPDMNLNPTVRDEFDIKVWSDTDPIGVKIRVSETGEATGIFLGKIKFTIKEQSTGSVLRVSEGDTITAEYKDKTLPDPYSQDAEITISATTMIGTLVPPLERILSSEPSIRDIYGNLLAEGSVGQEICIISSLANKQDKDQLYAYILQITDKNGIEVFNTSKSGILKKGESVTPVIKWKPSKGGGFKITSFVWESLQIPTALTSPKETEFVIHSEVESKEEKEKAALRSHVFPKKFTIIIPSGTSVPGCEETKSCFIPNELTIRVNQTVIWKNNDSAAHCITSGTPSTGPDYNFDSSLFETGKSFAVNFKKKGKYPYFCPTHPWQTGTIFVE